MSSLDEGQSVVYDDQVGECRVENVPPANVSSPEASSFTTSQQTESPPPFSIPSIFKHDYSLDVCLDPNSPYYEELKEKQDKQIEKEKWWNDLPEGIRKALEEFFEFFRIVQGVQKFGEMVVDAIIGGVKKATGDSKNQTTGKSSSESGESAKKGTTAETSGKGKTIAASKGNAQTSSTGHSKRSAASPAVTSPSLVKAHEEGIVLQAEAATPVKLTHDFKMFSPQAAEHSHQEATLPHLESASLTVDKRDQEDASSLQEGRNDRSPAPVPQFLVSHHHEGVPIAVVNPDLPFPFTPRERQSGPVLGISREGGQGDLSRALAATITNVWEEPARSVPDGSAFPQILNQPNQEDRPDFNRYRLTFKSPVPESFDEVQDEGAKRVVSYDGVNPEGGFGFLNPQKERGGEVDATVATFAPVPPQLFLNQNQKEVWAGQTFAAFDSNNIHRRPGPVKDDSNSSNHQGRDGQFAQSGERDRGDRDDRRDDERKEQDSYPTDEKIA